MMGGVRSTRDQAAMGRGGSRPLTKLPKAGRYSNMPHFYTTMDIVTIGQQHDWIICVAKILRDPMELLRGRRMMYELQTIDKLWECCPTSSQTSCSTILDIKMASCLLEDFPSSEYLLSCGPWLLRVLHLYANIYWYLSR